ncbi:hypothetical protein BZL29_7805 [Mycobacterium kansasii]|uniref:Uncharacterized protein n=1 Tax=Mycobacterium kansasii TaxID=1768 RepID=A0A1V3WEL6_MYCKA|nr:hypothetical protein BZL29_7805 [Mycobacterium kansasii]
MFVAKWYTRASRVRIVIAKFDGRWKLPGGPYPIPELVALVGGLLTTLFALPRFDQPLLTGAVGVIITVVAVTIMRRMPYSPVKFSTRVHRIYRLYTNPTSNSGSDQRRLDTVSTVRPTITILDTIDAATITPHHTAPRRLHPAQTVTDNGWVDLFDQTPSAAAELFT